MPHAPPISFFFILVPLRPKYSPQHPQPTFLRQCDRPSFTPIQNSIHNYVLFVLVSTWPHKTLRYDIPKLGTHTATLHYSNNTARYTFCTKENWRNAEGNNVTPLAVTPASWQPRRIDYFQASLDRITGPHFRSTTIFTPLRLSVHQQ